MRVVFPIQNQHLGLLSSRPESGAGYRSEWPLVFFFPYCGQRTDATAGAGCGVLSVDGQSSSVAGWEGAEPPPGSLRLILGSAEVSEPSSLPHT